MAGPGRIVRAVGEPLQAVALACALAHRATRRSPGRWALGLQVIAPYGPHAPSCFKPRGHVPWPTGVAEALRVDTGYVVAAGPTDAEVLLCAGLRRRAAAVWLVRDAESLVLVARASGRPQVPDVVRLVRQSGAIVVITDCAERQLMQRPHSMRLSAWAEIGPIEPVFCDC